MNCDTCKDLLADSLVGSLSVTDSEQVEEHLAECTACREQAAEIRPLWENLGLIPAGEPGPAARARFYEMLEAYQHGLAQARQPVRERINQWLSNWWPRQPLWQAAVAALCLAAGLGGGYSIQTREKQDPKLAQMSEEIRNMRQLVTLSLLQQQSASDRLRGVNWSYRLEVPDSEVLSALLHTLNSDENVNVRLAAVDALYKFTDSSMVRRSLRQSLAAQNSPIVQIALIDMLADLRDSQTVAVFRDVLNREDLNPEVRQRLERNITRLEPRRE
jgi:hypothetical protein